MKDLLVIGGGPVGLSTAIKAAQSGMSVSLFEPKSDVIDKACGEGLMPAAVHNLAQIGIDLKHSYPFKGIRYIDKTGFANGHFRCGSGLGVRRTVLHETLKRQCLNLGVEIVPHAVKGFEMKADHVEIAGQRGKYLIAADGLNSTVRDKLNVGLPPKRPQRLGIRQHFNMKPWSDYVEVYWSDYAEAYVTPVSENLVGVALLYYQDKHQRPKNQNQFDSLLCLFPELYDRVYKQEKGSIVRGAGPFERRASKHVIHRCMLVGDAAGYLDPLTGEGIRLGLDSGFAAIRCIKQERPQDYEREWKNISRRYWWMTDGLLRIRQINFLRNSMVPFLKNTPWIFDRLITALAIPRH